MATDQVTPDSESYWSAAPAAPSASDESYWSPKPPARPDLAVNPPPMPKSGVNVQPVSPLPPVGDIARSVFRPPNLSPEEKARATAGVTAGLKNVASGAAEGAAFYPKAAAQAVRGAANLVFNEPTSPYVQQSPVQAASDVLEGTGKLSTAALPEALVAAPAATVIGTAGAVAGGYGGQKLAEKAGAGPEGQRFAGNIAGLAGAFAGGLGGAKLDSFFHPAGKGIVTAADAAKTDPQASADVAKFRAILKSEGVDLPSDATLEQRIGVQAGRHQTSSRHQSGRQSGDTEEPHQRVGKYTKRLLPLFSSI